VEVLVVEPGVEERREVRIQDLPFGLGALHGGDEQATLQARQEEKRQDVVVDAAHELSGRLRVALAQVALDLPLVQALEPALGRLSKVEARPAELVRVPEVELAGVGVTLGMTVKELAEERSAGALDLRDEDERFAHLDQVLGPELAQPAVLVDHEIEPRARSITRA
jgi:hypothetical protein